MNTNKLQLFAILQDTVFNLNTGGHLARNYGLIKKDILNLFGKKKATSLQFLVYIGQVYTEIGDQKTFDDYIKNKNLDTLFNDQLNKMR